MMANSQLNYTEEQTKQLLQMYTEVGTEGLEDIAAQLGKPVRSIRSKLVREGVYIPALKMQDRKNGISKKEMLNTLQELVGFDTTGFSGSTKEALSSLIVYLKTHDDSQA
jgi:hypothetical protein